MDVGDTGSRARRVQELRRRIEELESREESDFGRFTAWDWGFCVILCVALPLLSVWWFAG